MLVVLAGCHWSRHEGLNPLEMIFRAVRWFEPPTVLCNVLSPVPLNSSFGIFMWVSAWLFLLKHISILCHLALIRIWVMRGVVFPLMRKIVWSIFLVLG